MPTYREPTELVEHVKNSGVKLDPDSRHYIPVSFVDVDEYYYTLEEATSSKRFIDTIRFGLDKFLNMENSWGKQDRDLVKNIVTEYPKALVDSNAIPVGNAVIQDYADPIVDMGQIRLPFPKITLVVTEAHDIDGNAGDWQHTKDAIKGVNGFQFIFLSQLDPDTVELCLPIVHEQTKRIVMYRTQLSIDGKYVTTHVAENHNGVIALDQSNMAYAVKVTLYTINKMTINGGEVYLDKPTPRSIQVNRKKLSKRKAPIVEFRLIKLDGYKPPELPSLPQGTHASPRQHWRRGHWRNLVSGKRVFIKPALVGDEKNGKIIKDYIVEEPAHAH